MWVISRQYAGVCAPHAFHPSKGAAADLLGQLAETLGLAYRGRRLGHLVDAEDDDFTETFVDPVEVERSSPSRDLDKSLFPGTTVDGRIYLAGYDVDGNLERFQIVGNGEGDSFEAKLFDVKTTLPIDISLPSLDDEPREYTDDETRSLLMRHVWGLIHYWLHETRATTTAKQLEGLAFSMCSMFDGGLLGLPAFAVVPLPHEDDEAYHRGEGECWFPFSEQPDHDIGPLHECFHHHDPRRPVTVQEAAERAIREATGL